MGEIGEGLGIHVALPILGDIEGDCGSAMLTATLVIFVPRVSSVSWFLLRLVGGVSHTFKGRVFDIGSQVENNLRNFAFRY